MESLRQAQARRLHDAALERMLGEWGLRNGEGRAVVGVIYETHYPVLKYLPLDEAFGLIGRLAVERLSRG